MSEHPQGQKHCSFCGKTQSEVGKLIAGEDAYICNECVDVCLDLVQTSHNMSLVRISQKRPCRLQCITITSA